jgi:hypothetical protein
MVEAPAGKAACLPEHAPLAWQYDRHWIAKFILIASGRT